MCYVLLLMLVVIIPRALVSVEKKIKKKINLVYFRNVEEFRSRNQVKVTNSHNMRQHFALSHAHSGTDRREVTVI